MFSNGVAPRFSALQRAEIAEIEQTFYHPVRWRVSVLFNEPKLLKSYRRHVSDKRASTSFSALQRAEIAEIRQWPCEVLRFGPVSVLFNEPKLLKSPSPTPAPACTVSVLFNEPKLLKSEAEERRDCSAEEFQCSSTSRNC